MLLVTGALVLGLAGCGDEADTEPAAPSEAPAGARTGGHVHGLGVNPRDGSLLIATHDGLFRVRDDDTKAKRIGNRHRDTMGFTVIGPDRFVASGHPDMQDLRNDLPPFLGLMESRDAGRSWRSLSLLGKVDFHALEARGRIVYGSGSDWESRSARFLVSNNGGRTWQRRQPPEPLLSVAADPEEPTRLIGAGQQALHRSADGGRTWRPLDGPPGLVAFSGPREAVLVDGAGNVHAGDGEGSWSRVGKVDGQPAAFEATDDGHLYVALHEGPIKVSRDGGRSWSVRADMAA